MSLPPSPPTPSPVRSRGLTRAAQAALVVLGGVVGLFTGLEATQSLFLGAVHLSIGAVAAFVANVGFGAFGAWGLRTRDAALAPGAGWFLAVLGLLFLPHPGGDIVVPGSGGDAVAFLLAGIGGIVGAALLGARIVPRQASLRPPLHR